MTDHNTQRDAAAEHGAGSGVSAAAQAAAVGALAFLIVVTVAWWVLALWPVPTNAPDWVGRARAVCFNAGPDGLPDASGWLLLAGQPLGMVAFLMAIAGRAVRAGLATLSSGGAGRAAIAGTVLLLSMGLAASGGRVVQANAAARVVLPGEELPPDTYPRLDREAPSLDLVDQNGERLDLASLRGRPTLVTFAFGHCETVCPVVVHQSVEVQKQLREQVAAGAAASTRVPRVVVVTLDPRRDTPSRLPHLAEHWSVSEDAFVLSGEVNEVEAVLTAWNVARKRDPETGDIVHPPLIYILDASGRIAFATSGGVPAMLELLGRT